MQEQMTWYTADTMSRYPRPRRHDIPIDLNPGTGYVFEGMDEVTAHQLAEMANDEGIRTMTPGDTTRRFVDEQTALDWYADPERKRKVYTLSDHPENLSTEGVAWFSQAHTPGSEAPHTFVVRVGDRLRGRRVGMSFMQAVFALAYRDHGVGDVWLIVREDNIPAQRLYQQFGFEVVHIIQGEGEPGRLLMERILSEREVAA